MISCPACNAPTRVKDTREISHGVHRKSHGCKRQRVCRTCGMEFLTIEVIVHDGDHAKHLLATVKLTKPRQAKE